jgi:hypothetical protein
MKMALYETKFPTMFGPMKCGGSDTGKPPECGAPVEFYWCDSDDSFFGDMCFFCKKHRVKFREENHEFLTTKDPFTFDTESQPWR